jgi:septal ring factor EnvC (AmiA/AmiB activator)
MRLVLRILTGTTLIIYCFAFHASAQQKTRAALEKERKENLSRIKEAEEILKETESRKENTLGQLRALNEKINATNELIGTYQSEISLLNSEVDEKEVIITSLSTDLENLKKEYERMILNTYKESRGYSVVSFLFTAESFNQFVKRLQYLRQYANSRQKQVELIEIVKVTLLEEKVELEGIRSEKEELLNEQISESKNLSKLQSKQSVVVKRLQNKEKELRAELKQRKKAIEELDKTIAELVKAELARKKSELARRESNELSELFRKQQAKLDWPVSSGFISSRFGRQPHPVLKGIEIDNRGIDIQTNNNAKVKTVFDGEIVSVAFVPGMNNVILIRHGNYYTLYAKVKNVLVKKGDLVAKNQVIAEVAIDAEGTSELQFQVWNKGNKQDPQKWLVKK